VTENADLSFQMASYTNILGLLPTDFILLAVPLARKFGAGFVARPRHRVTVFTSL